MFRCCSTMSMRFVPKALPGLRNVRIWLATPRDTLSQLDWYRELASLVPAASRQVPLRGRLLQPREVLPHVGALQINVARPDGYPVQYEVGHQLALYPQVPLVGLELRRDEGRPPSRASMISNRSTAFWVGMGAVMKPSMMSSCTPSRSSSAS